MVIYDDNDQVITDPDLTAGELREEIRIKPDATPVDNVKKFAWYDDDYETILRYHVWTDEELEQRATQEAEAAKAEAREAFLAEAPEIQAEQDAAIIELYEGQLAMQDEFDEYIISTFEQTLEVNDG